MSAGIWLVIVLSITLTHGHPSNEHGTRTVGWPGTQVMGVPKQEISDRLLAFDEEDNIHEEEYLAWHIRQLAVPVFFAVGALVVLLFCMPCKFLGLCGGQQVGHGVCANDPGNFQGYHKMEVLGTKAVVVVCTGLCFGAMVIGVAGNSATTSSVGNVFNAVLQIGLNAINTANTIEAEIYALEPNLTVTSVFQAARNSTRDMMEETANMQTTVLEYDAYRARALGGCIFFPVLCLCIATTLALCNITKLNVHLACSCCLIWATFVFWLILAVHLLLVHVFQDVCVEAKHFTAPDPALQNPGGLNKLLQCSSGGPLRGFYDTARAGIELARWEACHTVSSLCNSSLPPTPPVLSGPGCTAALANETCTTTYLSNSTHGMFAQLHVFPSGETFNECATNPTCVAHEDAKYATNAVEKFPKYETLIEVHILPLVDCTFIKAQVLVLQKPICRQLVPALRAVASGYILSVVAIFFAVIALILGNKRFVALDSRFVAGTEAFDDFWEEEEKLDAPPPVGAGGVVADFPDDFADGDFDHPGNDNFEVGSYDVGTHDMSYDAPTYDGALTMDYSMEESDESGEGKKYSKKV